MKEKKVTNLIIGIFKIVVWGLTSFTGLLIYELMYAGIGRWIFSITTSVILGIIVFKRRWEWIGFVLLVLSLYLIFLLLPSNDCGFKSNKFPYNPLETECDCLGIKIYEGFINPDIKCVGKVLE